MSRFQRPRLWLILCSVLLASACNDPARPGKRAGKPVSTALLCACKPKHITKDDWRIELKNGSLPQGQPQDVTVADIFAWPSGTEPGPRTPRSGKELELFRIRKAYMQTAFLREGDCDLHVEISEQPDKNAPRMIIETPARRSTARPEPASSPIYSIEASLLPS